MKIENNHKKLRTSTSLKPELKKLTDANTTLFEEIRELIAQARVAVVRNVDFLQVWTNFQIGRSIVEYEQMGSNRAKYSDRTLVKLSEKLTHEFGRGFTQRNLELMRKLYLTYFEKTSKSMISKSDEKKLTDKSSKETLYQSGIFTLSWTHYIFLMSIDNPDERSFYEVEAASQHWSVRELKRQFNTSLYEQLVLSRNKNKVKELSKHGQIIEKPEDTLKQPYVLEFLGLDERNEYSETELETAIINKIEQFLLELGKGFLFEARQKRITIEDKHFHVDLVFYNRLLRCYVLIDLKIGELIHQDIGQMQMYVNYFDRKIKLQDENSTVGIILCKHNEQAIVEMTLPKDNKQIFAGKYRLLIPSKLQLRKQINSVQI